MGSGQGGRQDVRTMECYVTKSIWSWIYSKMWGEWVESSLVFSTMCPHISFTTIRDCAELAAETQDAGGSLVTHNLDARPPSK